MGIIMKNCDCTELHQYCKECMDEKLNTYKHIIKEHLAYQFKTYETFNGFIKTEEYKVAEDGIKDINYVSVFELVTLINKIKKEVVKEYMLLLFPDQKSLIHMMTTYYDLR